MVPQTEANSGINPEGGVNPRLPMNGGRGGEVSAGMGNSVGNSSMGSHGALTGSRLAEHKEVARPTS